MNNESMMLMLLLKLHNKKILAPDKPNTPNIFIPITSNVLQTTNLEINLNFNINTIEYIESKSSNNESVNFSMERNVMAK